MLYILIWQVDLLNFIKFGTLTGNKAFHVVEKTL